jgi:hypothetical protein
MTVYERLIRHGLTEADGRGSAIDHVTARRMAIWLLPRSHEDMGFMRGLLRFAKTGAITYDLKDRLRHQARSPSHPNRPHAARLLQYAVARGTHLGPIGENFGGICDQIDRADIMLADLRDRIRNGQAAPEAEARDVSGHQSIAMAHYEPSSQTVSFILDAATANAAIHAISVNAADREAHAREIQQRSQSFPEGSYGKSNRETIAARESRIATRLRTVERAYQSALGPKATPAPDLTQVLGSAGRTPPDRELEME